jgi:hypothetical protein
MLLSTFNKEEENKTEMKKENERVIYFSLFLQSRAVYLFVMHCDSYLLSIHFHRTVLHSDNGSLYHGFGFLLHE